MRENARISALYHDAAQATARGSRSFYFATRFFPEDLARSAHAVYWFCRTTDDLVDECQDRAQGAIDLAAWELQLRAALDGGSSADPVLHLFARTVADHDIPHEYAFDLIEGMRMDLNATRYETFQDLRVFCYRVASVVGLMMTHVIGFVSSNERARGLKYAIDLGIAMQLTNILRDIADDLRLGRIYIPAEEIERFSYSDERLRAHVCDESFRRMMRFQVERARWYYRRAEPGIALLNPRGRFAVRIAADVYSRILDRIERVGYNVFAGRAVVPSTEKYWITARSLAGPALRHIFGGVAGWRT